MKAYPAYKDSGIDWLGEIPAHWNLQRLKWLVREKLQYGANEAPESEDRSLPRYIRITDFGGDGKLKEDTFKSLSYEKAKEYLLTEGDILFARSGATVGKTFQFTNYKGSACFAGYLIKAVPDEKKIISDFLYAFTKSISYENWKKGIFIQATIQNIGADKYNSLPITVPPLSEQRTIAAFLDHKTRLIDTYIAKKQQQIERLQAYRTALINQAVTKGLNPDAPVKDSGIEWLGEIPAHWAIHSFRRIIKSIEQGWSPIAENRLASPTEWAVIKLNAVKQGVFQPEEHKVLPENVEVNKHYKIKNGDFLLTRANTPDLVGDVCIAENIPFNLLLSDLVYRISVEEHKSDKKYLCYWFLSAGRHQIMSDARGSSQSMVKISQSHIRAWTIIAPPLFEQKAIASFLNTETAKIDTLITKTQRQIDRLQSYRTSLISEAVTGKIDVRTDNYRDYT